MRAVPGDEAGTPLSAMSPMTTTSLPASSLTPPTMVFSSCMVTNGKGKAIVTAVGMKTRVGKIAAMLTTETKTKCGCLPDTSDNMTPMQVGFHHLAVRIGYGALVVCAIVFGVGGWFIEQCKKQKVPSG